MRVGIVTCHWVANYGAILQAMGLVKALKSLGHEPVIVDYVMDVDRRAMMRDWGIWDGNLLSMLSMRRRFWRFRERHLPISRRYRSHAEIQADFASYDAFVVGSDQVWNCDRFGPNHNFDSAYFLGFAEGSGHRRLSYAACFGHPNQSESCMAEARKLLQSFDSISVRNEVSRSLVRKLVDRDPDVVVDPTLLVDFEAEASQSSHSGKYLLVYALDKAYRKRFPPVVAEIARKLSLPVVAISPRWDFPGAHDQRRVVDPAEWLALFRDAAYVCTDSYHGVMFSIKNHKPFAAYLEHGPRSHRLTDQLSRYGLEERIVWGDSQAARIMPDLELDYRSVDQLLAFHIQFSYEFLKSSLRDAIPACKLRVRRTADENPHPSFHEG